jgi:flagellar hook-associated protein 2
MATPISFGSSSVDLLVAQFMQIERQPIVALEGDRSVLEARLSMYATLQTRLKDLRDAAGDLASTLSSSPFNLKTATSSDTDILTATAGAGAISGTYSLLVTQLAKTDTVLSNVFTDTGSDIISGEGTGTKTFDITVNGTTTTVSVTLASGEDNETVLGNIAQAINDSGAAVNASVVHDTPTSSRLEIKSDNSGQTYAITLADNGGTLLNTLGMDETRVATDSLGGTIYTDKTNLNAELTLDGISITRDSNTISDLLDGVTINLLGYQNPSDIPVTLTISPDAEGIQAELEDFITKYNDVISYLNENMAVDPENSVRGMLAGNYTFTSLRSTLRSIVTGYVSSVDPGNVQLLSEIGIEVNSDGTLTMSDASELEDALTEDPDQVADLFNSSSGIAVQLDSLLYDYAKAGGIVDDVESSIGTQIDYIDTRIDRIESRLAIRELELRQEMTDLQDLYMTLIFQQQQMQQFYGTYVASL